MLGRVSWRPLLPRTIAKSTRQIGSGRKLHGASHTTVTHALSVSVIGAIFLTGWLSYSSESRTLYAEQAKDVIRHKSSTGNDEKDKVQQGSKLGHDDPTPQSNTRSIRLEEVRKHGATAETVWVTRGTSVYDITEWIPGHPGGKVILNAGGGSIDAYWAIFTIHLKPEVAEILESYKIGEIDAQDLVDGHVPATEVTDPFRDEPDRDRRLIVHSQRPRNAETPTEGLKSFITTPELFYVRNHLWVPNLSPVERQKFKVTLERLDGEESAFTLDDLDRMEQHTVTVTLQCSGNRRSHMGHDSPVSGLPWSAGAISTATFTGPLLSDVLEKAGVGLKSTPKLGDLGPEELHLQASGLEGYGASIPLLKALDPRGDVMLATVMNGYPIPRDHGSPVRLVVPGIVAARSVKFLSRLRISEEESQSQWQRRDYKSFGPNETQRTADWDSALAIQETPINSAVTNIEEKYAVKGEGIDGHDSVVLSGYAFAGGGRGVARVDISVDGARTWSQAKILRDNAQGHGRWAWTRWRHEVDRLEIERGGEVVVKAVDSSYNVQPESHAGIHNFRGNLANAWHRVPYPQTSAPGSK